MTFNVTYPYITLLLSAILAALFSWFLYFVNPLNFNKKILSYLLTALRFTTLFCICFLLTDPVVKIHFRKVEKPVIIIAADNSKSVLMSKDSMYYKTSLPADLLKFSEKLNNNFKIEYWPFGAFVNSSDKLVFNKQQTNISEVFNQSVNKFSNLNLGAIVLVTDGIYNTGEDPIYAAEKIKVPIYTVALGDTNYKSDILISSVKYNEIAFEDNVFNIVAEIKHSNYNNKNLLVWVEHNNVKIASTQINTANTGFTQVPFKINAGPEGLKTYIVKIQHANNELSYLNNTYSFQVNVLKSKQKILILYLNPHPDVAAFKQALAANANLQVSAVAVNKFSVNNLKQSDLVIFHQLPGNGNEGYNIALSALQQNIPCLFVTGINSNIYAFNQLPLNLNLKLNNQNFNYANALFNDDFTLFNTNKEEYRYFIKFPPMQTPYGNYQLPADAQILFYQQIGYAKTNNPLIFFSKNNNTNTGFIIGDGFWRWRLHDYLANQNHKLTNDLINKCVQLLAVKSDKSKFRVFPVTKQFYTSDNVVFNAELYNDANELTNKPDADITITYPNKKKYNYTFSKTDNAYNINAGELPEGNYTYTAKALTYSKNGSFSVLPQYAEFLNTRANHSMLFGISNQTGGSMYYANQLDKLFYDLTNNSNIKPVIYHNSELKSLINIKLIFYMLILLLTSEWFVRKYNGYI